ncbi:MAG: hypothetical protein H6625_10505 [Bdellovibrionaceae bacterium]|nr:hypothetical protein [Pseudobdellovibrionaceae bacterium]
MKSVLFFIAVAMASTAWASKARVNSLQGANHLIDTQTVFTSPSHILLLDPNLTFEFGAAGAGAEGGLLKELSNGNKLFLYLGHQNTTASDAAGDMRTSAGYLSQNNPLEIIYGLNNMAFGASVSRVENDAAQTNETTLIGKWGMNYDNDKGWSYAHLSLIQSSEKPSGATKDEAKISPYFTLGGSYSYWTDKRIYAEVDYGTGEESFGAGGNLKADDLNLTLGFENIFMKSEETQAYYGIEYRMDKRTAKSGATELTAESTTLPVYLGLEYKANSWATVRASVKQNVIYGSAKDEIAASASAKVDGIGSNTTVAAGLGLRYNNIILDGSLTAAANGNINGNQFLSQASLTYNF